MKHVREPLPDVQRLRPEVSAALAAVVERATAKETAATATPTVDEMVHDLEQVLAIEAARAGEADRRGHHRAARAARRHRRLRAACACAIRGALAR